MNSAEGFVNLRVITNATAKMEKCEIGIHFVTD